MAQVSEKRILELQQIIKEEYGRDVTFSEVSEIANGLVGYFDLLAKVDWESKKEEEAG